MATDRSNEGSNALRRLLQRPVNRMETLSEAAYAYILLIPAFILLAIVAFYPLIATFRMSLLADETAGADPFGEFVGIQNYIDVFTGNTRLTREFVDVGSRDRSRSLSSGRRSFDRRFSSRSRSRS